MKKEIKEKLIKERLDRVKTRINEMLRKLGSTDLRMRIEEEISPVDGKTKIYSLCMRSEKRQLTHEFKRAIEEKEIKEMSEILLSIEHVLEYLVAEKTQKYYQ